MLNLKRNIKHFLLVFVASFYSFTAVANVNDRFLELLDYEVQNRALAYEMMADFAESESPGGKKQFWRAYSQLEVLNQKVYSPIAAKYQLPMEQTLVTNITRWLGEVTYHLFPETWMEMIHGDTVIYVGDLKEMKRLSDPIDSSFFQYVVDQEIVQAQAMELVIKGRAGQGAKLIEEFLSENTFAKN